MTINPRASWIAKRATFPLSWTWGSYNINAAGYGSAPLVLAPLATLVRLAVHPDIYNNPRGGHDAPGEGEPAIGYEECFSFNVVSAGAVAAGLLREWSMNGAAYFQIDNTALAVAAGPAGATTNTVTAANLRRFPAYPFLRYTITNNDPVFAITLNFVLTLRAA